MPSVNRKSLILLVRLYYHATSVTVWMEEKKKILGDFRRKLISLNSKMIFVAIIATGDCVKLLPAVNFFSPENYAFSYAFSLRKYKIYTQQV